MDREAQIRGGTVAVLAVQAGARAVELAVPLQSVCEDLNPTQQPSLRRMLARHAVTCTADQDLVATDGGLVLRDMWSEAERRVDVDVVVFVGFRRARSRLGLELTSALPDVTIRWAGDCVAPRRLYDAVKEGAEAGAAV